MGKTKAFSTTIKLGALGVLCYPLFLTAKSAEYNVNEPFSVSIAPDSIGVEVVNGEINIIHRIERKETYYALSRRYNIPVNRIMEVNNKKTLKPGDTVKVPTGRQGSSMTTVSSAPQTQQQEQPMVLTEYKVGKSETLYAISRRFGTTVEAIKKMNDLQSDSLREGITLKIPNADYREPIPEIPQQPILIDTSSTLELTPEQIIASNRYGIREKQEKGIGVWINDLETDGKSNLALHKTAPIGTILKITNPMTRNVTYAKVVGKFTDTAETKDAIVVLSKSAAAYIGALDRRFLIEIAYGVPLQ
ncbi:LysM peptidoglycan-binding domain-containing protein [Sphingobacterium corticibacterium]|uniref:LysM peptidoglycan-binding domain-containing protein n=1 Tax=Sphingobacterium corticibacterium TaxID=2484746 RepID=A0A4Q6XWX5_9SPHI|nr:LysM peptidoglycan-binding domain-containing protein [Sphingobacterium corticibacterium]RZF62262.1 LysM peptidoglycan-binding domain-containing protein [Sphingobacterium corticibacterium]